jgi:protein ImuB
VLWIALHLPLLSLESFAATLQRTPNSAAAAASAAEPPTEPPTEPPLALMDTHRIVSANAAARALGVKPGLKRATALALAPQLVLGRADPARDAQALAAVAFAALAFTPGVAIQPVADPAAAPDTVLLEVQRCLRYFGGLPALQQRLLQALAPLGHNVQMVSAPTALGAALLARVHRRWHGADLNTLRAALDAAPVWLLGPGREHWEALEGMGLRTLGDLRRLPRAGLARRFGEALLDELDRALGARPDPREPIALPPSFASRLELFARADTTEQVLYGAAVLLQRLVAWLGAQHAFVRRFTLVMQHEPRRRSDAATPADTRLEIALAEPSRDAAHLQVLLRERLAALQLPAPTLDLQLHAADIAHRAPPNSELFPTAGSEREGLTRLIERLQARLGPQQVQRLVPLPDHRPECAGELHPADPTRGAWAGTAGGSARTAAKAAGKAGRKAHPAAGSQTETPTGLEARSGSAPAPGPRSSCPVWLLQPPEPLAERRSRPLLDGQPLQLLSGPERVEAGWWDGGLAERDYFIAQTPEGALVWIYRARLPLSAAAGEGWFMQGRFA